MEDYLLQQYNNQLANEAGNLFQQRNRDLVNQAAMDVIAQGYNQGLGALPGSENGMAFMGDPSPATANIDIGGMTFAPGDPMAAEKGNEMAYDGFLGRMANNQGIRGSVTRSAISGLGRLAGLGTIASTGLGLAFAPFAGLAGILSNAQSSLFGRSKSISGYLEAKRNQKIAQEVANRGAIKQNRQRSEELSRDAARVTNRDAARGNPGGGGGMSNAQAAANRDAARGRY